MSMLECLYNIQTLAGRRGYESSSTVVNQALASPSAANGRRHLEDWLVTSTAV